MIAMDTKLQILEQLKKMKNELATKEKKLKKHRRSLAIKNYVQNKVKEMNSLVLNSEEGGFESESSVEKTVKQSSKKSHLCVQGRKESKLLELSETKDGMPKKCASHALNETFVIQPVAPCFESTDIKSSISSDSYDNDVVCDQRDENERKNSSCHNNFTKISHKGNTSQNLVLNVGHQSVSEGTIDIGSAPDLELHLNCESIVMGRDSCSAERLSVKCKKPRELSLKRKRNASGATSVGETDLTHKSGGMPSKVFVSETVDGENKTEKCNNDNNDKFDKFGCGDEGDDNQDYNEKEMECTGGKEKKLGRAAGVCMEMDVGVDVKDLSNFTANIHSNTAAKEDVVGLHVRRKKRGLSVGFRGSRRKKSSIKKEDNCNKHGSHAEELAEDGVSAKGSCDFKMQSSFAHHSKYGHTINTCTNTHVKKGMDEDSRKEVGCHRNLDRFNDLKTENTKVSKTKDLSTSGSPKNIKHSASVLSGLFENLVSESQLRSVTKDFSLSDSSFEELLQRKKSSEDPSLCPDLIQNDSLENKTVETRCLTIHSEKVFDHHSSHQELSETCSVEAGEGNSCHAKDGESVAQDMNIVVSACGEGGLKCDSNENNNNFLSIKEEELSHKSDCDGNKGMGGSNSALLENSDDNTHSSSREKDRELHSTLNNAAEKLEVDFPKQQDQPVFDSSSKSSDDGDVNEDDDIFVPSSPVLFTPPREEISPHEILEGNEEQGEQSDRRDKLTVDKTNEETKPKPSEGCDSKCHNKKQNENLESLEERSLKHITGLQIPESGGHVVGFEVCFLHQGRLKMELVVILQAHFLSIFTQTRAKSEYSLREKIPFEQGEVARSFVSNQISEKATNTVFLAVCLETSCDHIIKVVTLNNQYYRVLDCIKRQKSMLMMCSLSNKDFAAAYTPVTNEKGAFHIQIYNVWNMEQVTPGVELEPGEGTLSSLVCLQNLPCCIVAWTHQHCLYLWNTDSGLLLWKKNFMHLLTSDCRLSQVVWQQGYLFLSCLYLNKAASAGCCVLVNPVSDCSKVLCHYAGDNWQGMKSCDSFGDYLVGISRNDQVYLWDNVCEQPCHASFQPGILALTGQQKKIFICYQHCLHAFSC